MAKRMAGEVILSDAMGATLRRWREAFGITQVELASKLLISPSVISDYEAGRRRPGSRFVRRFVETLIDIDESRGGERMRVLVDATPRLGEAIIDMKEFAVPVRAHLLVEQVDGVVLACQGLLDRYIYGYTVLDSIRAIQTLSGPDFIQVLGTTTERALVFTKVSTGRSPMVAVRVQSLKPKIVIIHGLKDVDRLAIHLAELEQIPLVLSLKPSVEALVTALNMLHSNRR
ncbi:MAG: helix-turn-helix domain-containing protein [Candidatus Bathyarchaeia archaeon]